MTFTGNYLTVLIAHQAIELRMLEFDMRWGQSPQSPQTRMLYSYMYILWAKYLADDVLEQDLPWRLSHSWQLQCSQLLFACLPASVWMPAIMLLISARATDTHIANGRALNWRLRGWSALYGVAAAFVCCCAALRRATALKLTLVPFKVMRFINCKNSFN